MPGKQTNTPRRSSRKSTAFTPGGPNLKDFQWDESLSPKTPGWLSGRNVVFKTPNSPIGNSTHRSSVYHQSKVGDNKLHQENQHISSPPIAKRTRRSSVYKKTAVRLVDIDLSPEKPSRGSKIASPKGVITRARRSSIYHKGGAKLVQIEEENEINAKTKKPSKPIKPAAESSLSADSKKKMPVKSRTRATDVIKPDSTKLPIPKHTAVQSPSQVVRKRKSLDKPTSPAAKKSKVVPKVTNNAKQPRSKLKQDSEISQIITSPDNTNTSLGKRKTPAKVSGELSKTLEKNNTPVSKTKTEAYKKKSVGTNVTKSPGVKTSSYVRKTPVVNKSKTPITNPPRVKTSTPASKTPVDNKSKTPITNPAAVETNTAAQKTPVIPKSKSPVVKTPARKTPVVNTSRPTPLKNTPVRKTPVNVKTKKLVHTVKSLETPTFETPMETSTPVKSTVSITKTAAVITSDTTFNGTPVTSQTIPLVQKSVKKQKLSEEKSISSSKKQILSDSLGRVSVKQKSVIVLSPPSSGKKLKTPKKIPKTPVIKRKTTPSRIAETLEKTTDVFTTCVEDDEPFNITLTDDNMSITSQKSDILETTYSHSSRCIIL